MKHLNNRKGAKISCISSCQVANNKTVHHSQHLVGSRTDFWSGVVFNGLDQWREILNATAQIIFLTTAFFSSLCLSLSCLTMIMLYAQSQSKKCFSQFGLEGLDWTLFSVNVLGEANEIQSKHCMSMNMTIVFKFNAWCCFTQPTP